MKPACPGYTKRESGLGRQGNWKNHRGGHDSAVKECDAGIKMGVEAIQEVEQYSSDPELRQFLKSNMAEHEKLQSELQKLLDQYHDDGKDPNAMAKGMSWLKTNIKLAVDESDKTIADLITDGCNMGVKSLNRYLNQYEAADEKSKDIAKRVISPGRDLGKGYPEIPIETPGGLPL